MALSEAQERFDAVRRDCQSIVSSISALEVEAAAYFRKMKDDMAMAQREVADLQDELQAQAGSAVNLQRTKIRMESEIVVPQASVPALEQRSYLAEQISVTRSNAIRKELAASNTYAREMVAPEYGNTKEVDVEVEQPAKQKVSVVKLLCSIPVSGVEDERFPKGEKDSEVMRRGERVSPETESARETPGVETSILAPPLSSSPSQLTPNTTSPLKRLTSTITTRTMPEQPSRNNHQSNRKSSHTKPLTLPPTSHALSSQSLSTATLLPSRRKRTGPSIFDIPSSDSIGAEDTSIPSSDEDNDDELYHPPTKKPGTRNQARSTKLKAAGSGKKLSPVERRRATAAVKKAAAVEGTGAKTPGTKTKARRKYVRRDVVYDKEKKREKIGANPGASHNSPRDRVNKKGGGGDGGDGRIRIGAPEVKRAAAWAREVEKWKLEFEEVTGSSSDSMMRDAR